MGLMQDVADRLAAKALDIGLTAPDGSWARRKVDPPALAIEIPAWEGTDLEEPESQLGADDWRLEFKAWIWLSLRDETTSQTRLVAHLEAWIAALKADPTLGETVEDARVVRALPSFVLDVAQPLVGYETHVRVLLLV